jgi:uncharacterized membrane protein (DUF2068 family)
LEHRVRKKEPLGFAVIGAMKLGSGVLLLAAGFELFRLMNHDVGEVLQRLVSRMHLDPENRVVHDIVYQLGGIDRARLKEIGIGTLFYAMLHFIEGTGLILRRTWAGYMTVIITSSLLPVEIYELARKLTALRALVLAVNLGFVFYIVVKLIQERRAERLSSMATEGEAIRDDH